jgi:Fur family ferric uptake transcriptional regulator
MISISKKSLKGKSGRIEDSRAALNIAGTRVTSQRALILETIRQDEGHLDADEIYRRARQRQPRLSLSTVYRTVHALKKLGLIQELHFDESHHHYEAKPPTKHHHLVCLGCGRVIEFQYPLSRIKRNVAGGGDFEIVDADIRVTGYCPRCRQDRE